MTELHWYHNYNQERIIHHYDKNHAFLKRTTLMWTVRKLYKNFVSGFGFTTPALYL